MKVYPNKLLELENLLEVDKNTIEKFNSKDINVMLGKAGEGVFEDTFSYHKGTTPQKPRLIFQVEYSI